MHLIDIGCDWTKLTVCEVNAVEENTFHFTFHTYSILCSYFKVHTFNLVLILYYVSRYLQWSSTDLKQFNVLL